MVMTGQVTYAIKDTAYEGMEIKAVSNLWAS